MKPKILKTQIEDMYNLAIQCRDESSARVLLQDFAERNNVSYKYLVMITRQYGKENNNKSVFDIISEREMNAVSSIVSKDPQNLQRCFRQYVSQTYPELTKQGKGNKKAYDRHVARISSMWYSKCSKKHVCFMTVSKRGKAIVNGKSTAKVNVNYNNGFFKSLRMKIIALFKQVF